MRYITAVALAALTTMPAQSTTDWAACADSLNSLAQRSRDAQDAADYAESASQDLASAQDELDDCLAYPETLDPYGDGCKTIREDRNSAREALETAAAAAEDSIASMKRSLRETSLACDVQLLQP